MAGDIGDSGQQKHLRTDHLIGDLKRRSIRGGVVTMTSQVLKVVIQFAAIVVLARLLAPADFGLFAMVAAFLVILELFKDLGLSSATVQRPDITQRQISTLFWLNVGLGIAVAAVLAALAPGLAWLYGESVLLEITPVVALTLVFSGIAAQHLALLRRQMRFTVLAVVQTGSEVVGLAAAVVAAAVGMGLWALVIQRLAWGLAVAIAAWCASGWRPGLPGRFSDVRSMIAFGGNATGAMLLGRLASNMDKVLIGWYWGAVPLGMFERAQKLLMAPMRNINTPLATVALPALSRLVDQPDRYRDAYVATAERLTMLVAPLAALMIAAAEPVVALIFGPKWAEVAPILSWMGLSTVYMPITYTLSWLYMSQDRTSEMLRAGLVNAVLVVAAMLVALPFGVVAIAATYAVSGILLRAPILFWLAGRRGPIGVRHFARALALPATATAAAAAALFAIRQSAALAELPNYALVLALAAVAGIICLGIYATTPRGRGILKHSLNLPRLIFEREARA